MEWHLRNKGQRIGREQGKETVLWEYMSYPVCFCCVFSRYLFCVFGSGKEATYDDLCRQQVYLNESTHLYNQHGSVHLGQEPFRTEYIFWGPSLDTLIGGSLGICYSHCDSMVRVNTSLLMAASGTNGLTLSGSMSRTLPFPTYAHQSPSSPNHQSLFTTPEDVLKTQDYQKSLSDHEGVLSIVQQQAPVSRSLPVPSTTAHPIYQSGPPSKWNPITGYNRLETYKEGVQMDHPHHGIPERPPQDSLEEFYPSSSSDEGGSVWTLGSEEHDVDLRLNISPVADGEITDNNTVPSVLVSGGDLSPLLLHSPATASDPADNTTDPVGFLSDVNNDNDNTSTTNSTTSPQQPCKNHKYDLLAALEALKKAKDRLAHTSPSTLTDHRDAALLEDIIHQARRLGGHEARVQAAESMRERAGLMHVARWERQIMDKTVKAAWSRRTHTHKVIVEDVLRVVKDLEARLEGALDAEVLCEEEVRRRLGLL